jgi:ankyrin repeat protein
LKDPNCLLQTDANGWAAIHFAASSGNAELIPILHKFGAEMNLYTQHKVGLTPLIIACSKNFSSTVKLLIQCGANPNLGRKIDRRTPLHFCAEKNFPETALVLIEADPSLIDLPDKEGKTCITMALK